ncbi:MAG: sensor histidine kinase, partial [Methanobacterium sp.]
IQNRAKAVELINEMLYKSEDFAMIDFASYIRNLTEYLYDFYNVNPRLIRLDMDIEGIPLDIDVAIPCGLIINELVTNSIKHAFNGNKGKIFINFSRKNDRTILIVADNGKGLPEKLKLDEADTSGFRLVNKLVNQLNGRIELNRNNGTEFRIIF